MSGNAVERCALRGVPVRMLIFRGWESAIFNFARELKAGLFKAESNRLKLYLTSICSELFLAFCRAAAFGSLEDPHSFGFD